jgi:hypothetical protein
MQPSEAFVVSFIVNMVLVIVIMMVHIWNPYAYRMALAKRFVFIIKQDMEIEPVSAYAENGAYVTSKHGRFEFDRKDVVHYGKKPGIFALEWMTRAVRPDCLQGLEYLKKNKIKSYDQLCAVVDADVISWQDYLAQYPKEKDKFVRMFGDLVQSTEIESTQEHTGEVPEYTPHEEVITDEHSTDKT